jgi:hypothetical protein
MNLRNKFNFALASTLILLSAIAPSIAHAAGAASLSLSPGGGAYSIGSTFAVTIAENSGSDSVNVVEADLSYNAANLQLVGISCNTGAFEVNAPGNGSGVTCGTATPKTGSQAVAVANFKAVGAGSASVSFASSSHIYRSTDNTDVWDGNTSGGSYSVITPAPVTTHRSTGSSATTAPPVTTATPQVKASTSKKVSSPKTVVASSTPVKNKSYVATYVVLIVLLIAAVGYEIRRRLAMSGKKISTSASKLSTVANK